MGSLQAGVRQQPVAQPPDVQEFKKMCSTLAKNEDPEQCMRFCLDKLESKPVEMMLELHVDADICRVVRHFSHNTDKYLSNSAKAEMAFNFLNFAIHYYVPNTRNDSALYRIIVKVAQTNDQSLVEMVLNFTQESFAKPTFVEFIFQGAQMEVLWSNLFVKNPVAGALMSPIVNMAASQYKFVDVSKVQQMLVRSMTDFNDLTISPEMLSNSLLFVGYVIRNIDTGDYLPNLLPLINDWATSLDTLSFLEPMIFAKTSDPPAIWAAIDAICANETLPLDLLESALMAIYNSGAIPCPDPSIFSFNSFVPRIVELSEYMQKTLFETIARCEIPTIADFFCSVQPLSQTGVSTEFLWQVSAGLSWGTHLDVVVKYMLIDTDLEEVQLDLSSDEHFYRMALGFIEQMGAQTTIVIELIDRLYELAKEGDEKAEAIFRRALERITPGSYMGRIIQILGGEDVPDNVMRIFTAVSGSVLAFNQTFFKAGGVEKIGKIAGTTAGLDFLASLVCDGPVQVVDDYISKHFDDLPFVNCTKEQLIKLMMGVSQNSTKPGFLRIPSLAHYVQDFPIMTPFDRYVCGAMAVKYFTPTSEHIRKFAGTYMDRDLAFHACLDPEILPSLTDPTYPHFSLYFFHPSARKCVTTMKRSVTFTFWFLVAEMLDNRPTVLVTFPGGSLVMESNGYFTSGNKNVHCPLHQWHMVTLCSVSKGNNQRSLMVYLDAKFLNEVNATDVQTVTLGSETECHAIWYASVFIHHSSKVLEQKRITKYYELGPRNPSKARTQVSSTVRIVPYRGVLRYLHVLGGPTFIFGSMLNCQDEEHYMLLLQAAFNLRRLGVFEERNFFASMLYVVRRKLDLYSQNAEQIIMHELTVGSKMDWKNLQLLMGNYYLMASDAVHFRFLSNALDVDSNSKESLPFFHMAIDTFVFFDLSTPIQDKTLQIIEKFIAGDHELLKKLPMVIAAMARTDTDEAIVDLNDPAQQKKQRILYDLWTKDPVLFREQTPCGVALHWVHRMNDEISVDLFYFISTICADFPNYFAFNEFKKMAPFLWLHSRDEKVWIALFQFLMQTKATTLDDLMTFNVARAPVFPIVLDLLAGLIPYDITDTSENSLSFKVVHLVFSLLVQQEDHLFEHIGSIQNICSLGFAERPPCQMPFGSSPGKPANVIRRISRPKIFQSTVDGPHAMDLTPPEAEIRNLAEMDAELEQATKAHMQLFDIDSTQSMEIELPEPEVPTEWEQVEKSHTCRIVAVIAAKTLVHVSDDTSRFKNSLAPLTIYGADVHPSVALLMHRRVILALLENSPHIPGDAFHALLEFLTYRVLEGWWRGYETALFKAVALAVTTSHRTVPTFVVACLKSVTSTEDLLAMAKLLVQNRIGTFCASNRNAVMAICHLLVTEELSKVEGAGQLFMDLGSKLEKNDLIEAVCNNGLTKWIEALHEEGASVYHSFCDQMMEHAAANISAVATERMELTRRSRKSDVILIMRTNLDHVNYLRRSFRFQFFYRVNRSSLVVLEGLNQLFKMAALIDHSRAIPERYSLVPAPHPFIVPMKLVPMMFPYQCAYVKTSEEMKAPCSYHVVTLESHNVPELDVLFCGPKCLEGWRLPPCLNFGISSLITHCYSPVSPIFGCEMLIGPEPLSCVAVPTADSLFLIMGATLHENDVVILEDCDAICTYPLIEMGMYGLLGPSSLFINHVTIEIKYDLVTFVQERTYIHEPRALDIYVACGCHYTLVFDLAQQKSLLQKLKPRVPASGKRGVGFASYLNSQKFDAVVKLWTSGKLSNMDYLLYLNTKGGRSFNDYSQYPVFPWTISDYETDTSENLKLRDLSKPMGLQTPYRVEKFKEMYEETDPPYNYGTHYSYPIGVLRMLMRIEPNTIYNVHFHQGFDHPDRLFFSVAEAWKGSAELNHADVQEVIPEMYALPCVYENTNQLDLPNRSDGCSTSDVVLPPWARESAVQFVWIMRQVLESNRVSRKLSRWVDLIFGFKQRGEAAVEAVNVFYPLAYSDCQRSDSPEQRQAEDESILNFGQCPKQLFQKECPKSHAPAIVDISNSCPYTSLLRATGSSCVHLFVEDEEIFASGSFRHYVGASKVLLSIFDGMFITGSSAQYDSAVFDMRASAVSSDRMYVVVCCDYGALLTYFIKDKGNSVTCVPISRTLCPGTQWNCCAISSHYGIVCAASPNDLCMYDMTTGYLLRYCSISNVNQIVFDETHDFVIVVAETSLIVFGLDFREIASGAAEVAITSVCVGDSIRWSPDPWFVTGHSNGSRVLWGIDVLGQVLTSMPLPMAHEAPVTAICIFHDNRAVISCDSQGFMSLLSVKDMKDTVLKAEFFNGCPSCREPLRRGEIFNCSNCGLPYCRKCFSLSASKCRRCESAKGPYTPGSLPTPVTQLALSPRLSLGDAVRPQESIPKRPIMNIHKQMSVNIGSLRRRTSMAQIFTSDSSSTIVDTLVQDFSVQSESNTSESESPR